MAQRRILGLPTTRSGKRSFKALLWFAAAMGFFFLVGVTVLSVFRAIDIDPLTIAWYVVMFAMLGVAGLIGLAALVFAVHAVVRQGDRSLLLAVPVLVGIVVGFFAVGEAIGHDEPGADKPRDGGAGPSGHSNARAEETSPGVIQVTFDYVLGGDATGTRVTANTVTPLDAAGRPLEGVAAVTLPAAGGTDRAVAEFRLTPAELDAVKGFSICFTGAAGATFGCTRVTFDAR